MQNNRVPDFAKRAQFYLSQSYVLQASSGSDYAALRPVILLAIANCNLFPGEKEVISCHKTLDIKTMKNKLKDLSYVFIELPKFNKRESELKTIQDKWIYFFCNWEKSKGIPHAVQEPELVEAYHSMEKFNRTEEEREAYVKVNIAVTDEYRRVEVAREEGLKEGKKAGIEEGKKEGKKEKIAIARNLIKSGMSPEQVAKITALPLEDFTSP